MCPLDSTLDHHATDGSHAAPDRQRTAQILGGILVVATFSRIGYTVGQSVTFDEYFELELVKEPVYQIVNRGDGFPPLYALVLRCWQGLAGAHAGIASARALSIVLGVACCVAIYFLARRAAGRTVGLVAAGLLAILPIHMYHTSEARAYSLLMLITCLGLTAALKAIESHRLGDWAMFSGWAICGLYTHYFFAFFVAIVLLTGLILTRDWRPFLSGALIVAGIVPLWWFWLAPDLNLQQGWSYLVPFGLGKLCYTYASFLFGYTLGPSLRELHPPMTFGSAVVSIAPWAVMAAGSLGTIFLMARSRLPGQASEILLVAVVFGPILTGVACLGLNVGYQVRYVAWVAVPMTVWMSHLMVAAWPRRSGRIATLVLIGILLIAAIHRSTLNRYRNEDLAAVARCVTSDSQPPCPVVVVSGYMVQPLKYYLDADRWDLAATPMEYEQENVLREFESLLDQHVRTHDVVWFLYTRPFHEDPDGRLFRRMKDVAELELVHAYAGIKLYRAIVRQIRE